MRTPEPNTPAAQRCAASRRRRAVPPLLAAAVLLAGGGALAQVPLGSDAFGGFLPFTPPAGMDPASGMDPAGGMPRFDSVETFDPVARARLLARDMPLIWIGSYQPFGSTETVPVQMLLVRPRPMGQQVDLRGEMRIGEVVSPVQGNLNARSDQLDLLLLRPVGLASLEPGGVFTGLQGLSLAGWQASRLTNPGGRLVLSPQQIQEPLTPAGGSPTAPIRGLW